MHRHHRALPAQRGHRSAARGPRRHRPFARALPDGRAHRHQHQPPTGEDPPRVVQAALCHGRARRRLPARRRRVLRHVSEPARRGARRHRLGSRGQRRPPARHQQLDRRHGRRRDGAARRDRGDRPLSRRRRIRDLLIEAGRAWARAVRRAQTASFITSRATPRSSSRTRGCSRSAPGLRKRATEICCGRCFRGAGPPRRARSDPPACSAARPAAPARRRALRSCARWPRLAA